MNKIIEKLIKGMYQILFLCLPVKKNSILFNSFYGQYNDNPKYICDAFCRKHPEYKIYWVISNKSNEEIPRAFIQISPHSRKYYNVLSRAEIVVDNHLGIRAAQTNKCKWIYHLLNRKRRNQLCVSTWHGTAFKTIGLKKGNELISCSDAIILGNAIARDQIRDLYKYDGKIKLYGSPRNDIILNKKSDWEIKKIKKKLGLPTEKKIIVYAPTFRGKEENYGIDIFSKLEYPLLVNLLKNKFGGEWVVVVRAHHVALGELIKTNKKLISNENIVGGNVGDDMGEYLTCADILITDYSGNMFDFMLSLKPCFIYAPDFDYFKNVSRGLIINEKELPFTVSRNMKELEESIMLFDDKLYKKDAQEFMNKYEYAECGDASEKTVELIDKFISTKNKDTTLE